MSNRVTIEIGGQEYELKKDDKGENSCSKCALSLMCWNLRGEETPPCVELTTGPDWYFVKTESITDKKVTI